VAALLLFLPASTVHYWEAWISLAIFIPADGHFSFYFYKHDPALPERRKQSHEK
jgi:hypothetical protein